MFLTSALGLGTTSARHPTHAVFFDEFEHVNIAQNLARGGMFAESLAKGSELDVLDAPTWPAGFHVPLALFFRLTQPTEANAFRFNAIIGSLAIVLVFLAGHLAFDDPTAGLTAAAIWAALPLRLIYARSTDLSMSSLFWIAASLSALFLYVRERRGRLFLLLAATAVYAAHTRFENLLLLAFIAAYLKMTGAIPKLTPAKSAAFITALGAVLAPLVFLIWRNSARAIPGFGPDFLPAARNLLSHTPGNLAYLLRSPAFSLLVLPAAICQLITEPRARRETVFLFALAGGYLALYGCFFRGDFSNGSEDRYALAVLLLIILCAGGGIASLSRRAGAPKILPAAACLLFFIFSLPQYKARSPGLFEDEERFVRDSAALLPPDQFVVSYSVPLILCAAERPAVSPYLILNDGFLGQDKHPSLVVFKDYWWRERAKDSERLEELLGRGYRWRPIIERTVSGQAMGFYELTRL